MSKTYRKVLKFGICTGTNTEYYRSKRKAQRKQLAHELRAAMQYHDIDEHILPTKFIMHDDWREPTDGTWRMDKEGFDNRLRWGEGVGFYNTQWWVRKYKHLLKSKKQHAIFRNYRKNK